LSFSFFKNLFDLCFPIFLLVVFFPFILFLIIILSISLKGNPFFFQKRIGFDSKPFKLIKFRSMTSELDQNGDLLPDEVRMTKVGQILRKFSIDELPQLFNILKGEMSLIGPRPLLPEYLPLYSDFQQKRHNVKPGITGWAQVNGRNSISWEEKFKLDVWYVNNQSFSLDIKILFLTVLKVLKKDGISSDTSLTMERFKGSSHKAE